MMAMISTNSPSTGQQHTASTLLEVVLGLHWDPPSRSASGHTPDLDALCVLCDAQGSALEIVHPNNPCGGQGSIVHTGDSQTGASSWDDERIFVFLDALPQAVSSLVFIVASAAGHSFDEVPGALCHLSDALSEAECFSQDLTALVGRRIHVVASLRRTSAGWSILRDSDAADAELLGKVRRMLDELKRGDKSRTAGPR